MNRFGYVLTVLVLILLVATGSITAKEYVSLNGGFYITIPDNWEQIDFTTVDEYLARSNADLKAYEYDAVLALEGEHQFFTDEYLIITIDNFRRFTQKKKDSILTALGLTYDRRVENGYLSRFMEDPIRDVPIYDPEVDASFVLRKMFMPDKSVKYSLNYAKFTDSGMVNFFFFTPRSKFETNKDRFLDIFLSYNTENIRDKLPKEEVKVADIEVSQTDAEPADNSSDDDSSSTTWIPYFVVFLILAIVVIRRRKRKTEES